MKKVLLIKITSMGDLIQVFPAITDAAKAIPGIRFDWVAEESFRDIPRLHPSVDKVISLPYRRWKKNLKQSALSGEPRLFIKQLRNERYDMVIDAQSNLKSAAVSLLSKGRRYGLDSKSVREYGAHWAYQKTISVDRQQNHAERMRQLMAIFLGYEQPTTIADYGIDKQAFPELDFALPEKFVFVTAICSNTDRLWPEPYWGVVLNDLVQSGYAVMLPWWSDEEKARALRLKGQSSKIHLLPQLNLTQKANVLSKAVGSISLDTGLAHLAAALQIPNVSLYGQTSAKLTGTYGAYQTHVSASDPACVPCLKMKCTYPGKSIFRPACMETIKPEQVLRAFYELIV